MMSEWRHFFLFLGRNKDLQETLSHKQFKNRNDWFSTEGWGWTFLSNCYLEFSNFGNFGKIINQKDFPKIMRKIFEFSKKGRNLKEPYQVYKCTTFHVDILKNGRVLVFWRSKKAIFHALSISAFPDFQNLSDLRRSKSVLGSFFAF